jgi:zinc transport system substrate-binding protein
MHNRTIRSAAALLSAVLSILMIFTGCGRDGVSGSENARDDGGGEGFNIVTSFFPVYVAVINVTHDVPGVTVTNMTEPQTGCLHDYVLRPQDLKLLEDADAFVINGAGMEAFLDEVTAQRKDLKIIEAAEGIPLLTEDDGEENPHVWLSLTNAVRYVRNIAARLSEADKDNAALYEQNATAYIKKLEELGKEMHAGIDSLKNRDIITFHEAFPYFAQEFDLNIAAVVEREPGTEPTQQELVEIIETVKQTGIKALFAEPQYSSGAAKIIAGETGAVLYTLDPVVTGEAVPEAADAYLDAMRRNMETLMEALR